MNKTIIEEALKRYKINEGKIKTTLSRIEAYKKAIDDPDSYSYITLGSPTELGMPRSTNMKSSSVENIIRDKEDSIEQMKEWIKEDLSRIYPLQLEKEQLDGALNILKETERYIIECKYFEGMFWRDIELNFNNKFRRENHITKERLKQINGKILKELSKILKNFYDKKR